eukprot:GEMP01087812.1.p1 GENE.GEMP01087812.1~~GEMP01087812.1.p1  ORF type:complete len:152 (+),score=24.75 GEMP01087812.1:69-458(+)
MMAFWSFALMTPIIAGNLRVAAEVPLLPLHEAPDHTPRRLNFLYVTATSWRMWHNYMEHIKCEGAAEECDEQRMEALKWTLIITLVLVVAIIACVFCWVAMCGCRRQEAIKEEDDSKSSLTSSDDCIIW